MVAGLSFLQSLLRQLWQDAAEDGLVHAQRQADAQIIHVFGEEAIDCVLAGLDDGDPIDLF